MASAVPQDHPSLQHTFEDHQRRFSHLVPSKPPQMCLLGAVSQAIKHSDHVTQDSILQVFIQENKADVPTKACTRMFTALGFTTAKR